MGIASIILGAVALACSLGVELGGSGVGIVCAIVGIILGAQAKKNPEEAGKGKCGIILSLIALLWNIVLTAIAVVCVGCITAAVYGYAS